MFFPMLLSSMDNSISVRPRETREIVTNSSARNIVSGDNFCIIINEY